MWPGVKPIVERQWAGTSTGRDVSEFLKNYGVPTAITIVYLALCASLIPIATDDIRLADVFSIDEAGAAMEIRHYHQTGRLDRASFKYGSLFYYVPLAALTPVGWFVEVDDRVILIVLRTFCTLAGAGCIWLVFLIGRRFFDPTAGATAAFLTAASPVFFRWSVESHPDLPQLLCVCAFLYVVGGLATRRDGRRAALAAVFAGLAFNVKYVGVFLMPTLAVTLLFLGDGDRFGVDLRRAANLQRWRQVALAVLAFLGVFAVTNPYAVRDFGSFVAALQFEREIMSFGHSFKKAGGFLAWGQQVGSVVGWVHVVVFGATLAWWLSRRERPAPVAVALAFWAVSYLAYLSLFSHLIRPRHVLPVFPVLSVGVGWAYATAWSALSRHEAFAAARFALPVVAIAGLAQTVPATMEVVANRWARDDASDEISAGRWIGDNYATDTTVLYDAYGYVPGAFLDVARTFGMTALEVEHFRPDLLIVRDAIASDYADTSRAADSRIGRVAFMDSYWFYRYLKEGRIPEYERVKAFPTVTIYARTEKLAPRDLPWLRLMAMYSQAKALGVTAARRRMSDAHMLAGRHDAASEQRMLAEDARNHAMEHYNRARAFLEASRPEEARKTFDTLLTMVSARPDSYRAAIHQHVSRAFFEAGYYGEAVREARRAITLYDGLHDAHYELGIFLLAMGENAASDSAFASAVSRFGPSPRTRGLLEQIAQKDIAPEQARRAMARFFPR